MYLFGIAAPAVLLLILLHRGATSTGARGVRAPTSSAYGTKQKQQHIANITKLALQRISIDPPPADAAASRLYYSQPCARVCVITELIKPW